jgi:hypothetical protein
VFSCLLWCTYRFVCFVFRGGGGQYLIMLFELFSQSGVQQDFHITRCPCHSSVTRQEPLVEQELLTIFRLTKFTPDLVGFAIPNNTKSVIHTFWFPLWYVFYNLSFKYTYLGYLLALGHLQNVIKIQNFTLKHIY